MQLSLNDKVVLVLEKYFFSKNKELLSLNFAIPQSTQPIESKEKSCIHSSNFQQNNVCKNQNQKFENFSKMQNSSEKVQNEAHFLKNFPEIEKQ